MSAQDYPFTGEVGTCQYQEQQVKTQLTAFYAVAADSPRALEDALMQQPVSVAIDAQSRSFQFYRSGIYDSTTCGTELNHHVLAVGWGIENGQPYYILKNSWGAGWGDGGYVKVASVPGDGICGVQKNGEVAVAHDKK